jgi:hypothetical protein
MANSRAAFFVFSVNEKRRVPFLAFRNYDMGNFVWKWNFEYTMAAVVEKHARTASYVANPSRRAMCSTMLASLHLNRAASGLEITQLPPELISFILLELPPRDLASAARACREMRSVAAPLLAYARTVHLLKLGQAVSLGDLRLALPQVKNLRPRVVALPSRPRVVALPSSSPPSLAPFSRCFWGWRLEYTDETAHVLCGQFSRVQRNGSTLNVWMKVTHYTNPTVDELIHSEPYVRSAHAVFLGAAAVGWLISGDQLTVWTDARQSGFAPPARRSVAASPSGSAS